MKLYRVLTIVCCLLSVVSASEFMIDTLGTHTQWDPAVAFDGENFLVAWADYRSAGEGIYCSRVNPDAGVLDPVGFPVSATGNLAYYPAVAFDGTNYLVVWEQRNPSSADMDVFGRRVSPSGQALDSTPMVISNPPGDQRFPSLAFDGENYLVVWHDRGIHPADVYGARVTPAGTVLDSGGFIISDAPAEQALAKVAFDGTNYLVVWHDTRYSEGYDVYGARVTPDGRVLDSAGFIISDAPGKQILPRVAFDGENYLVVWRDNRAGLLDIYGARVDRNGTVLDTAGITIRTDTLILYWPVVAFDGTNYLSIWEAGDAEPPDLYGASVSPDGPAGDAFPVVVAPRSQYHCALACGAGAVFLVYNDNTYMVGNKYYGNPRIWGKFGPFPGVAEAMNDERGVRNFGPTVVRGTLLMPDFSARLSTSALHNSTGRKVLDLRPGPNDVRHLAPGVYFVREPSGVGSKASSSRKVILTR